MLLAAIVVLVARWLPVRQLVVLLLCEFLDVLRGQLDHRRVSSKHGVVLALSGIGGINLLSGINWYGINLLSIECRSL